MLIAGEKPIIAKKFMSQMDVWAKANGAQAVETFSTEDTVKINERLGMSKMYVLMRRSLEGKD